MTKTLTAKNRLKPPEQTHEEPKYFKRLIDTQVLIRVKLTDDQEITGRLEFYDLTFIRLTRDDGPNLFIFKHDIKYLFEVPE